ncbi:MAG TPA: hypothetical protein VNJ29_04185 [Candidatus Nitrosotenuis sp.]|jgi:hypothetical protein|nr:hypothetical protein [Candidatus Nitrosotenuis sp.]
MNQLDTFFKIFSSEAYVYEFIENGTILLRSLHWFRHLEKPRNPNCFFQPNEQYAAQSFKPVVCGLALDKLLAQKREPEDHHKYMFSMHKPTIQENHHLLIDKKFLCFGDFAIVILDAGEFLKRFEEAITSISETRSYYMNNIDYSDLGSLNNPDSLKADVTKGEGYFWHKDPKFHWQNEYRLMWETFNVDGDDVLLHLGNMSDIAKVFPTRQLICC